MTIKAAIAEAIRRTPTAAAWTVDDILRNKDFFNGVSKALYAHAETILAASELAKSAMTVARVQYGAGPGDALYDDLATLRLPDPEPDAEQIIRDVLPLNWADLVMDALSAAKLKIVKDASHDQA